jgi:acylphosphatase
VTAWQADPVIRRRVVVRGLVQGVFFRAATREQAQRLGVSGWARNCPDGSVEVVVEGEDSAVEQLVSWLRRGPEHARVERVEVSEESVRGERGFSTR